MAHSFSHSDTEFGIGDTVDIQYRIREGDKSRNQIYSGIVMKIRGSTSSNKMITVRRISRSGVGVERIFPLSSPFITDIKLKKKSHYPKSTLYFVRKFSQKRLRHKLYKSS